MSWGPALVLLCIAYIAMLRAFCWLEKRWKFKNVLPPPSRHCRRNDVESVP